VRKIAQRKTGLARSLSKLGYCSRSRAAELIRSGRVSVDGTVHRNPETPVSKRSRIAVDGTPVELCQHVYLMLNKPRGILTTTSDERGRETVYSILGDQAATGDFQKPSLPWVAPVGRLDKASEGLLLLTNDSAWAARITDPETYMDKTYHVQVNRLASEDFLESLVHGVKSKDELLRAKSARLLRSGQKNCWLEIVLDEGKNRHIRRMMEGCGVEVLRLIRVAIGDLQLGNLEKGAFRPLTNDEKKMLDRAMPDGGQ
jgi:23S rRNA pseudouridine2605 synthase